MIFSKHKTKTVQRCEGGTNSESPVRTLERRRQHAIHVEEQKRVMLGVDHESIWGREMAMSPPEIEGTTLSSALTFLTHSQTLSTGLNQSTDFSTRQILSQNWHLRRFFMHI
jgi:hypothetical protein